MDFRWNDWNIDHAGKHGVTREEAEHVVRFASRPYPQQTGRGKWYVVGRGNSRRLIEVAFVLDDDETVYIIHAMPIGGKRRRRRRSN